MAAITWTWAARGHASDQQAVLYGQDSRVEWRQLADSELKAQLRSSTAALIRRRDLRFEADGVSITSAPLAIRDNLCETERFRTQPTAAYCSGVLVDGDLVLTASHCVESSEECRDTFVVFDYVLTSATQLGITSASVFSCRDVLASPDEGSGWSLIQLERPAARQPLLPSQARIANGDKLINASHGQGLPLKIDPDGLFLDILPGGTELSVVVDSFGGGSGSALVGQDGGLVGFMQRGRQDYIERGDCNVARGVEAETGTETATSVQALTAEVCGGAWASAALCGDDERCGDGRCTLAEVEARCLEDCPDASCGDGVCDVDERDGCPEDCAPARGGVPFEWYCPFSWYGSDDGCQCECGAPDADCSDGATCDAYGPARRTTPALATLDSSPRGGCAAVAVPKSPPKTLWFAALGTVLIAALCGRRRSRHHRGG